MNDYYTVEDVKKITGASQSKSYNIIRTLRESFSKKYPEAITIQGKIPSWYFEEIMMNKKIERND